MNFYKSRRVKRNKYGKNGFVMVSALNNTRKFPKNYNSINGAAVHSLYHRLSFNWLVDESSSGL